jgi:hypothetical protein
VNESAWSVLRAADPVPLSVDSHPALYSLGVCYFAARQCHIAPLEPDWGLWCVLSHLFGLSNRDIRRYRDYWKALKEPYFNNTQAGYVRSNHATAAWYGLLRSVGLPPSREVMDSVYRVCRKLEAGQQQPDIF